MSSNRKKIITLHCREKGRCYYCGVYTYIAKSGTSWKGNEPKNLATVDHIYSKNDIRRFLCESVVLCCSNCNQKKNDKEYNGMHAGYEINPSFEIIDLYFIGT